MFAWADWYPLLWPHVVDLGWLQVECVDGEPAYANYGGGQTKPVFHDIIYVVDFEVAEHIQELQRNGASRLPSQPLIDSLWHIVAESSQWTHVELPDNLHRYFRSDTPTRHVDNLVCFDSKEMCVLTFFVSHTRPGRNMYTHLLYNK
jgi:hypothetical protein